MWLFAFPSKNSQRGVLTAQIKCNHRISGVVFIPFVPLCVMPAFCHLISWQQSQPTATEKCKQAREEQGCFSRQSAYGNVDLADGVCGYLCMSNFAFLWVRNVPRQQLECVCVVCARWSVCWFYPVSPPTVLEGPIARHILPRLLMCVCTEPHSTWAAFNIHIQVLKTCFD